MNDREFNSALRDLDQGTRAMKKAQKLARIRKEREQRAELLTQAAREMQKRGASQSSIRRFIEAYYEFLIITSKPAQPENADPAPVPLTSIGFLGKEGEKEAARRLELL